ncbi:MAG: phosphonate C-P lyase system protein PhnG [Syntrophobacterales bacterium]|nr:phosphonate C-P lyase system protein PhnG [Syntrophobacterales bacterium]
MYLNLQELQEAVTYLENFEVERILKLIEKLPIRFVRKPSSGVVMMTLTDTFDTPFHIGEILVTEVEVEHNGIKGYGMVLGQDKDRAFIRAVLEFLESSEAYDVIKESIRVILTNAWKREKLERSKYESLIDLSRVEFDILPGR